MWIKNVSTTLDQYEPEESFPIFMINNVSMMDVMLKGNDLISFMRPMCPQCHSSKVVKNGTCVRTMENGIIFRIQKYICRESGYSFLSS